MLTWAIPERRNAGFGLLPIHYRLLALGLKARQARELVNTMSRWVHHRGPKGYLEVVSRHKMAWLQYELRTKFSDWRSEIPGLSRTRSGLPLQTRFLVTLSVGNRARVLKLMKNLIRYDEVQPEQWEKFKTSALRPRPDSQWLRHYSDLCILGSTAYPSQDDLSFKDPTPVTEMPDEYGLKTFSPFDTRVSVPREPEKVLADSLRAASLYVPLSKVVPMFMSDYRTSTMNPPETAGLIGVTQEPGGKGRFFVSIHPVWQAYFTPLQAALKFRAYRDPAGCVRNQDSGRRKVAQVLGQGYKVHTFDLSDATNVFPLKLQTNWMIRTMCPEQVYMFESVSRKPLKTCEEIHERFGEDTLTYTVGQPLGLLPSAMAFHLTHIYLLRGLEMTLYGRIRNRFRVLVDDVCIWDGELARQYRLACDRMGITISETKSFASRSYSEFLGRVITPYKVHELTTQQPLTFDNASDYIRVMGTKIVKEFDNPIVRQFLTELSTLPEPWGSGMGNGKSREERFASRIGQTALVESNKIARKARPMGDVSSRVRAILKIAHNTAGMYLRPEIRNYLLRLLPRRRSLVPKAHYGHPEKGILWNGSSSTYERYITVGSLPSFLHREPPEWRALRNWREPNFGTRRKLERKDRGSYTRRCYGTWHGYLAS